MTVDPTDHAASPVTTAAQRPLSRPTPQAARFVDVHYHAGPDAYQRRYTAQASGELYAEHDGWVVLKNHLGSTAAQAWEARQHGLPVSGSLVLNDIGGGIDPRAMEQAVIQHGEDSPLRLIVHLPTATGRRHTSRLDRTPVHRLLKGGLRPLTVSDTERALRSDVDELFRAARDLPVVLSTGHASAPEVRLLIEAAVRYETRLMLNQPANPLTGLSCRDLLDLAAAEQVWTEQTALTVLLGYQSMQDFIDVLTTVPRLVYSSDLGQPDQMDIPEWLVWSREHFRRAGLSETRISQVTQEYPLRMLSP